MRRIAALGLLVAGRAHAAGCPDDAVHERYENGQFGFAVVIPAGTKAVSSAPCAPDGDGCVCLSDHGVLIQLPDGATIEVYGGYNAAEYASADEAVDASLASLGDEGVAPAVVRRERVRLGGVAGERALLRWFDAKLGRWQAEEVIEAVDLQRHMHYAVTLEGGHEARDRAALEAVRRGFARIPVSW